MIDYFLSRRITGWLQNKPAASVPELPCGINFRLSLPGFPDHRRPGKFTGFQRHTPFHIIIHGYINASVGFRGKENGFFRVSWEKISVLTGVITDYAPGNGMVILKYCSVPNVQRPEYLMLQIMEIGHAAEFFDQQPEEAVGRITVTVMGTRRKIERVGQLNGCQDILVCCVFNFECIGEAIMVRHTG